MRTRIIPLLAIVLMLGACQSLTNAFDELSLELQSATGTEAQGSSAQSNTDTQSTTQGQSNPAMQSDRWKPEIVNTGANAGYLTATERQVIAEINMARTDPPAYARAYLEPLHRYYSGKMLQYPGEIRIVTQEGASALDECIRVMESTKPLPPLSPKEGLSQAARDHVADQAKTGAVGHSGSDGSTPASRVSRYGHWGIAFGENIDYGNARARRIVTSLLIDDGVPSRGHRTNLLNPAFRFVGVAVGTHPKYGHMCVMDFAGSYN